MKQWVLEDRCSMIKRYGLGFVSWINAYASYDKRIPCRYWSACREPLTTCIHPQLFHYATELSLTLSQMQKIQHFARLLIECNQDVNLTAIRDWDQVITKHCIDSLTLVPCIRKLYPSLSGTLIDVGSGGGVPGIILAIAFPQWKVTLLDKTRKKTLLQQRMIKDLALDNRVNCVWSRAETLGHDKQVRESFDMVTARAVAQLHILVEWTIPLLKKGGYLLAQKSVDEQQSELKRATRTWQAMGASFYDIHYVEEEPSPKDGRRKAIVILHKDKYTPKIYPRSCEKKPL